MESLLEENAGGDTNFWLILLTLIIFSSENLKITQFYQWKCYDFFSLFFFFFLFQTKVESRLCPFLRIATVYKSVTQPPGKKRNTKVFLQLECAEVMSKKERQAWDLGEGLKIPLQMKTKTLSTVNKKNKRKTTVRN